MHYLNISPYLQIIMLQIFEGPSLLPKRSTPQLPQFQVSKNLDLFGFFFSWTSWPTNILCRWVMLCLGNMCKFVWLRIVCFVGFQEFHLKTSERAMQHNSTVLTSNIDKVKKVVLSFLQTWYNIMNNWFKKLWYSKRT